jgi:hypothetical protein
MVPISQSSQVPSKISVDFAVILMFKYVPAIFTSVFTARMLMQLKPGPQLCQSTGHIWPLHRLQNEAKEITLRCRFAIWKVKREARARGSFSEKD